MIAPTTSATPSITIPTATASAATDTNTLLSPGTENQSMTALHQAQPTVQGAKLKNYNFKKISAEDQGLEPELATILARHKVYKQEAYRYNTAVLSEDGNTLVMPLDGRTVLANYFGGRGATKRFLNRTVGCVPRTFGSHNTLLGTRKYKELYSKSHDAELDSDKGESLAELIKGLQTNHYHGVVVFEKDPKLGKFPKYPKALAITDSYALLVKSNISTIKPGGAEEEIKALEAQFKKYYSLDKVLPFFSMEEAKELGIDFNEIRHKIIEGLYQAQGFDLLAVASKLDFSSSSLSNKYIDKWHTISEKNNGSWKATGDASLVTNAIFTNTKEKAEYLANLKDEARSMTFVVPSAKAIETLPKELAILDALSQMSSGTESRAGEKEAALMKQVAKVNENTLASLSA